MFTGQEDSSSMEVSSPVISITQVMVVTKRGEVVLRVILEKYRA